MLCSNLVIPEDQVALSVRTGARLNSRTENPAGTGTDQIRKVCSTMPQHMTPAERSQRSRLAAHVLHSRYDSRDLTEAARKGFNDRFLDEVDPERKLPTQERERRAAHARKAYFTSLALKSARARRARSKRTSNDDGPAAA